MTERLRSFAFFPGAMVFPGGAVEPCDAVSAASSWSKDRRILDIPDFSFRHAAIRETFEETGLLVSLSSSPKVSQEDLRLLRRDLSAFRKENDPSGALKTERLLSFFKSSGLHPDVGHLVPFARWITPVRETRRFDTFFFTCEMDSSAENGHAQGICESDGQETARIVWMSLQDTINSCRLPAPTWYLLQHLQGQLQRTKDKNSREWQPANTFDCPWIPEFAPNDNTLLYLPSDALHSSQQSAHSELPDKPLPLQKQRLHINRLTEPYPQWKVKLETGDFCLDGK
jgi:8-oxo-dGTP pyrophosphatase MutT (NUDIX family)